jgi:hypothetical protein
MNIDYLKKNYSFVLRGLKYKNFKSLTLNVKINLLKSKKKRNQMLVYINQHLKYYVPR